MERKSGISMFILLITIIVVIILASTITISLDQISTKKDLSIFANNISAIEEYIKSCNILKEELPFDGELTLEEVKSRVDSEYIENFTNELLNNGDNLTVSFKKVDMSKIGVENKSTGYEKEGINDIYIYSELTGTVYYLMGIENEENIIFSINESVINKVK